MINIKLGLYTDPHFSQSSSIIVGRKGEFAGRLDNLIESFKWMNSFFKEQNVDKIICLGDMTDKPNLTAEEITALSRCDINDHVLIVGNHCRASKDGNINSLAVFKNVIKEPQWLCEGVYALPYNSNLVDLNEIKPKPKIILSHNDIKGYILNGHPMDCGYEISHILKSCDLFINGHLHSGGNVVPNRIINLGHLSAMNFASCDSEWEPSVMVLDTETLKYQLYENPKAYRFKKQEFNKLPKLKAYLDNLPNVGEYVLQIKVPEEISQDSRKLIEQCNKIVASRILTYKNKNISKEELKSFNIEQVSVYDKLKKFIKDKPPEKYSVKIINELIDKMMQEEESVT